MTGSINAALFLSQSVYWHSRTKDPDGWFYKSRAEWLEETGMKRTEQENARKRLVSLGLLDEVLKGTPARLYYRVNMDAISDLLVGAKPASKLAGNLPTDLHETCQQSINTESTTETTTEDLEIPEALKELWPEYLKMRKTKRYSTSAAWQKRQLAYLAKCQRPAALVEYCTRNGYQGLDETWLPKEQRAPKADEGLAEMRRRI